MRIAATALVATRHECTHRPHAVIHWRCTGGENTMKVGKVLMSAGLAIALSAAAMPASAAQTGVPSGIIVGKFCIKFTVGDVKFAIQSDDPFKDFKGNYVTSARDEGKLVTVKSPSDVLAENPGFPGGVPDNNALCYDAQAPSTYALVIF
jgi:hypothetical protein